MRKSIFTSSAVLAALVIGAPAGAASGFGGNVCKVVPASRVAAIPGVSSHCSNTAPTKGPGSTIYVGNWPGTTPTAPQLQVTISRYSDQGALQLATRNLKQGLPGTPRRVAGIGSAAFEATGASAIGIHFAVGNYVAYLSLTATGGTPRGTGSLEALAKGIAGRL